jgi:hypothetical protein
MSANLGISVKLQSQRSLKIDTLSLKALNWVYFIRISSKGE